MHAAHISNSITPRTIRVRVRTAAARERVRAANATTTTGAREHLQS